MRTLLPLIRQRLDSLNETQLRVLYSIVALLPLAWLVLATTVFVNGLDESTDRMSLDREMRGNRYVLIVRSVEEGGPGHEAGIRAGDRVLAINGTAVTHELLARKQSRRLRTEAPAGRPVVYVIERNGRVLPVELTLVERELSDGIFLVPLFYLFTLLWLAIGTLVALAQPRGRIQRAFFLTAASCAFAFSLPGVASGAFGGDSVITAVLVVLQTMTGAFFFSFWIYFCSLFPVDQNLFRSGYGKTVLAIPPSMMVIVLVFVAIVEATGEENVMAVVLFAISVGLMLLIDLLYFVGGIVLLYRGYSRLAPTAERRSIRVILAGAVITLIALLSLPLMLFFPAAGIKVGAALLIPMALILALPVSFGFAIFKYQVMDFRLVVKTTVVYVVTMMLVGGIYLGIAYGISQLFGALIARRFQDSIEIAVFVGCLLLFDPIKRQLQTAIENRFFPQRRDYSSHLASFASLVERSVNTRAIAALIASTLRQTLDLERVAVTSVASDALETMATSCREDGEECGEGSTPEPFDGEALTELARVLRRSHGIVSLEVVGGDHLAELRTRFAYGVGLFAQGRLVGLALISRPAGDGSLQGRQVQFLNGVATQGAAALEVARLYEEELARQRYDEQLAAARHIQQSLLATDVPRLPGLTASVAAQPAQAVGGDYFRVIRLDDARVLVIVADVSGKGLPAALYMAQLHGMVCIAGATCTTPAEILTTINGHLFEEMARGTFVTATVMIFDTGRGIVHYARAGHTPILVRNAAGLRTLAPRGLALGVVASTTFLGHLEERSLRFAPGDTFILYSDGVSEAMNEQRELYDDERLIATIDDAADAGPDDLCAAIVESVDRFRDGAEPNDDVSIVVIRAEAVTTDDRADELEPASIAVAAEA